MSQLINDLLNAFSVRQLTDIIENFMDKLQVGWRPVGDRENNLATINLGSDPAAGLIERTTNAIDAVLERKWIELGSPTNIQSPREAVETWFNIDEGRLENIDDPRQPEIADLSRKVRLILHDSDQRDRPTIDVRDYGIGILAKDFPESIVGLNETRKLKKFFLAGAFGQGGSTALSYPLYTVIISRHIHSVGSDPNKVAATIVRFNPGNPDTDKHGIYEYMIDRTNGFPFEFDIPISEFEPGTLVRHISMEIGKYIGVMTAPTSSLWYLTHHYLFDPVLPLRIEENRENKSKGENRFVGGNHRRLTQGKDIEYENEAKRTFRNGSVTITWWAISPEKPEARNTIRNFCLASKPIVITYNGQKQGELPNTIIKTDLRLPYLEKYLVVHIDCDKLDSESRRQLFPTTRESLRDTSILEDLRRLAIETLQGDEELYRLDRERKQRYMQRVDNESIENLRRRLASRVKQFIKGTGTGKSPNIPQPRPIPPSPPKPPIPTQEPPTFLEITSSDPKKVYSGRSFTLTFKTDADSVYFMDPDSFIAIIDPPSFGQYTGTTRVRNGYGTTYFRVADDLEEDTTAEITLELRPRRAKTLKGSVTAKVVPLPEGAGTESGTLSTPNINPMWVSEGDIFWTDNNWNEESVAKVQQDDESINIYVSADNKNLSKLVARALRQNVEAVESLKEFYLEHVSFHAMVADINEKHTETIDTSQTTDDDNGDQEEAMDRELKRVSETVCGIATQFFEMIVTGAAASAEGN